MIDRPAWMDHPETWVGMDVDVTLVADETRHAGRIVSVASYYSGGELLSPHYPTIELADGRRVGGLDCWWTKRETPT